MTVVDASVAVKWYLPESGSTEATSLLRSTEPLFAPQLIRIEVTAAILRKFHTSEITEHRAVAACDEWFAALANDTITLIPDDELYDEARQLALKFKYGFQDCLYLACANRLKRPLLTADTSLYKRAVAGFPAMQLLPGLQLN